jgi:hypothetical protein
MKQPQTDDPVGGRTEPVGPWCWVTDGLIEETIRVWEPRYGRKIGPEEAALILTRVVDFFRVLAEHSQHVEAGDLSAETPRTDHGDRT